MIKHFYESKSDAAKAASELLNKYFQLAKEPILFLVSGGSAFGVLENLKIGNIDMTIGVLDERYSEDEEINNFAQLTKTSFYKTAIENNFKFIDTRVKDGESQNELALRMESKLRKWRTENPKGKIVITQGIGGDGHTSGILPFPEDKHLFEKLFANPDKWVVDYDASGKNPYPLRVTTTFPFLKNVNLSVLFVCGEDKTEALTDALSDESGLNATPAKIITQMKDVHLFTDIKT